MSRAAHSGVDSAQTCRAAVSRGSISSPKEGHRMPMKASPSSQAAEALFRKSAARTRVKAESSRRSPRP